MRQMTLTQIWSTWLDQSVQAEVHLKYRLRVCSAWILSKFSMFHWIWAIFILLVSKGVGLLLCLAVTLS